MKRCPLCLYPGIVEITDMLEVSLNGRTYVSVVPALGCTSCKEIYVSGRTHEKFEKEIAISLCMKSELNKEELIFIRKAHGIRIKDLANFFELPREVLRVLEETGNPMYAIALVAVVAAGIRWRR